MAGTPGRSGQHVRFAGGRVTRAFQLLGLAVGITLAGCSPSSESSAVARNQDASEKSPTRATIVDTAAGRYRLDFEPSVEAGPLPSNADMKMADGDLGQYAVKLCQLDFANKLRPDRCEVFVQTDPSSLLVGYVTLQQGSGVTIETAIQTDRQRSGLGCWISGTLVDTDYERPAAKLDLSGDFNARLGYAAWEKSPGDWVVASGDDDSANTDAARGMWYFERKGNKLRVSQERWSYCYSDPSVAIDEVFVRAATLTKVSD